MYVCLYAIWGGGLYWLEDDFFPVGWVSSNRKGQIFFGRGGGIGQHNVTYRKNVTLRCGFSVPAAE